MYAANNLIADHKRGRTPVSTPPAHCTHFLVIISTKQQIKNPTRNLTGPGQRNRQRQLTDPRFVQQFDRQPLELEALYRLCGCGCEAGLVRVEMGGEG